MEAKKYKNTGTSILRFNVGDKEYSVLPGKSAMVEDSRYVRSLVNRGLLKEAPASAKPSTIEKAPAETAPAADKQTGGK